MIEIDGVLLPAHWVKSKVSELYEIVGGGTPSTKEERYWDGEISWISSADIYGIREIKPRRTITEEGIANSTTNLVPAESLVVVTRVGLGKIAITEKPICFSQDSHALVDKARLLFPDFFLYYLSQAVQKFKYQHRGTTIAGVTRKQLSDLPIPLPPLNEQRRIVSKIEELTAHSKRAREALEEVPKLIDQFRQSVLAAAFRGDLTAEWRAKIVLFSDVIISSQNGLSKRRGDNGELTNVLRLSDLSDSKFEGLDPRQIELTEAEKKYILNHNDLVCIRVNGSADLVGRTFLFSDKRKWAFCDHFIRFKLKESINPQFINLYFSSTAARSLIEKSFVSSAGQKTVSQKKLNSIPIPLPDKTTQDEAVSKIELAFSKIDWSLAHSRNAWNFLDSLDQSILAKAFRGELVPQDPNDEPASVLLERIRAEREKLGQSNKKGRSRRQKTTSQLSIEEL